MFTIHHNFQFETIYPVSVKKREEMLIKQTVCRHQSAQVCLTQGTASWLC